MRHIMTIHNNILKDHPFDVPVILVGNKVDQQYDRMVTYDEGRKRYQELGCVAFHEISVREDVDQVNQFSYLVSKSICQYMF